MSINFKNIPGGKWWKVDFHLHTPGSYDYGKGHPDQERQKLCQPKEFLQHCMEKELDCIVIADHNTVVWFDKLKNALKELRQLGEPWFREIVIFPGIEISVVGNIHLLGIFDPAIESEELYQIIGQFGYNEGEKGEKFATESLCKIMNIINKKKGIAIPAHVDKPCGLFETEASTIKSVLAETEILAMEVTEEKVTNALYIDSKLHLAYVLGSDSHNTQTIGDKYTWVKMGEPNIEALKLALYDGEDGAIRSISTADNPNDITGNLYLKELSIENARYMGRRVPFIVHFSPWLTNIIGGRGSGKSSILNFVRLLFDRQDELPASLRGEFDEFIKVPHKRDDLGMLLSREDKKTVVKMTVVSDGIEHLLKWEDSETFEYDSDAREWKTAVAVKDRFPFQIYSQKQLYEITKDPHLLFKHLDSRWDHDNWKREAERLTDEYLAIKREIRTQVNLNKQKKTEEAMLHDVEKKIAVFETNHTKTALEKERELSEQERLVKDIYYEYSPLIDAYNTLKKTIAERKEYDLTELDEDSRKTVTEWTASMNNLRMEFITLVTKYATSCISYNEYFNTINLSNLIADNRREIAEIVQELSKSGVSGINKYPELMRQRKSYKEKVEGYGNIDEKLKELHAKADQSLAQLSDLILQRIEARKSVIENWNQYGTLRIELVPLANLDENETAFRSIIGKDTEFASDILDFERDGENRKGIIADIAVAERKPEEQLERLETIKKQFIDLNEDRVSKKFARYLGKHFTVNPESVDRILAWIPEDGLKLSIKINGKYQSVDAGSPGQRTSAILSLLFAISNEPIIIDQPEDDLDTRNITDIIVEGIKMLKKKQQIILVTHNSNIVVNSNSEQVVQLDFRGGQIYINSSGALQEHAVRDAICNVMEGGKEALEKRYYRIFKALQD